MIREGLGFGSGPFFVRESGSRARRIAHSVYPMGHPDQSTRGLN
jgi:hypothetical protein